MMLTLDTFLPDADRRSNAVHAGLIVAGDQRACMIAAMAGLADFQAQFIAKGDLASARLMEAARVDLRSDLENLERVMFEMEILGGKTVAAWKPHRVARYERLVATREAARPLYKLTSRYLVMALRGANIKRMESELFHAAEADQ